VSYKSIDNPLLLKEGKKSTIKAVAIAAIVDDTTNIRISSTLLKLVILFDTADSFD
jgi:hypothetical protein